MIKRFRGSTKTNSRISAAVSSWVGVAANVIESSKLRASVPWVVLLLLAFGVQSLAAAMRKAATFDEVSHIAAGVSYLISDDLRLDAENGIADQRWLGLPALTHHWKFPTFDDSVKGLAGSAYRIGYAFLYESQNDADQILFDARAANLLLALTLGVLVWIWSRKLFGAVGALVSLAFYAFCPNLLANGALATSDVPAAAAMLWTLWSACRCLEKLTVGRVVCTGFLLGIALTTKASTALMLPVLVVLLGLRLCYGVWETAGIAEWILQSDKGQRGRLHVRSVAIALVIGGVAATAIATIWSLYGWRYMQASSAGEILANGMGETKDLGYIGGLIEAIGRLQLLPEGFLVNYADTLNRSMQRSAFALGYHADRGWWWFFPVSFLIKTPLASLFATTMLAATVWQRIRRRSAPHLFASPNAWSYAALLGTLATIWLVAISSNLNIGLRHIILVYPILYILLGFLGRHAVASRQAATGLALVLLLVLGQAAESLSVFPDYLAFFNVGAGGPKNGYRLLVDSNLDWGQDINGVAPWLQAHTTASERSEPSYLAYFGTASPAYYGVSARLLNDDLTLLTDHVSLYIGPLTQGIYFVSATILQGVYLPGSGAWNPSLEWQYQQEIAKMPESIASGRTNKFALLRLARLMALLRLETPIDAIGESILVYKINASDLAKFGEKY